MSDDVERVETTSISEAMRGERSFIEVPRATEVVTRPLDTQDYLDGLALRRLREALPEGYRMRLHPTGSVWFVDVWRGPDEPDRSRHWIGLSGDTIAEAAEACREALKGLGKGGDL